MPTRRDRYTAAVNSMTGAYEAGKLEHPEVQLDAAAFHAFIAALPQRGEHLATRAADLFLACAAARGDQRALAVLDDVLLSLTPAIERLTHSPALTDEVLQEARVRLFTGSDARIGNYQGEGSLRGFLHVVTTRLALMQLRDARRRESFSDALLDRIEDEASRSGIDVAAMKARYRPLLQEALDATLRSLAPKERGLLRLHFVQGLGIDRIGALYEVHRATAARWLVDLRGLLRERVARHFAAQLGAERVEDVDSLMKLVESQIDLSFGQLESWEPAETA